MSRSHLVAAPTILNFGDVQYHMSPLTDLDEAELDEYVQAKIIENARNSLPSNAPESLWEKTMVLAMKTSLGVAWSRPPGSKVFTTTMGLARLIWQGVKRNDKNITVAEIHSHLLDAKNVSEAYRQFKKVNAPPEEIEIVKGNGEANAANFPRQMNTGALSE
jgi:hypothetical protein